MKTHLFFISFIMLWVAFAKSQCSTTSSANIVVTTNTSITTASPNYVKVCVNGHAYDTSGSSGGRNYHLEAGGKLTLKMHSTTMVYAKSGSTLTVIGPGSTFLSYEPGVTIIGTANFASSCTAVSFPSSPSCATSITEIHGPGDFKIYPNPTKNSITIDYEGESGSYCSVINLLGSEVMRKSMNSQNYRLDLSSLAPGVYYLGIGKDNKTVAYKKIVIED
jgi:hypothetical protein